MADVARIVVINTFFRAGSEGTANHHLPVSKQSPIRDLVLELCQLWKLDEPEDFALKFEKTDEYVTEANRVRIDNGSVLKLCHSPGRIVRKLLDMIRTKKERPMVLVSAYNSLAEMCTDAAVAEEFVVREGGLDLVLEGVGGDQAVHMSGQMTAHLIRTFHEIMRHEGLVAWEDERLHAHFIGRIAANIDTEKSMAALKQDERTQSACLSILNELVNTPAKYETTEKDISVDVNTESGVLTVSGERKDEREETEEGDGGRT